jgi:hypothetical protein
MMKALLIVAGLFFSIFGAVIAYFAVSDPGHEYDLNFVLPIDTRQMPQPVAPPNVQSWSAGAEETVPTPDGRAEAGKAPSIPDRAPVEFGVRPGAASEAQLRR